MLEEEKREKEKKSKVKGLTLSLGKYPPTKIIQQSLKRKVRIQFLPLKIQFFFLLQTGLLLFFQENIN